MRNVNIDNENICKKYQETINESKTGYRRKVQLLDDRIDDLIDDIEKRIKKEEENPTYQRKLYQMLADMTKEHGEFLMSIKRIAGTIDSGAKTIPNAKGSMQPNRAQGFDEEPPAQQEPAAPEENNVNEKTPVKNENKYTWSQINKACMDAGFKPKVIAQLLSSLSNYDPK